MDPSLLGRFCIMTIDWDGVVSERVTIEDAVTPASLTGFTADVPSPAPSITPGSDVSAPVEPETPAPVKGLSIIHTILIALGAAVCAAGIAGLAIKRRMSRGNG
jgi:hypothetical protein